MSAWADGYVADIEYIAGYYRQQSPPHLMLAGLLGGVDSRPPRGSDAAHYMELGCGHGMNAVLVAAANPAWQVTAIDYNPAHIATGITLAQAAGLANVTFLEADLGTLAGSARGAAIPAADIVSMHGVWSWVSPAVRAGIVRLLAALVAPGGLVHLSYNALPAWQGGIGLQRLVYEAGRRGGGRSDRQVGAGLDCARAVYAAEARHVRADPFAAGLLDYANEASVGYLAHEYMNVNWSPCFHADVAAAMADAKLDWVASANLLETFPDLMLSEQQRLLLDRYDDPLLRELLKDMCLQRQLRHDTFIRGARRLSNPERDAALAELTVALAVPAAEFVFELQVPAGQAELGPAFRPVVAALENGPASIGALLAMVPGHSNPAELSAVLVGTNQAMVMPRPGAAQAAGAGRLNRVLGHRIKTVAGPEPSGGLASTALGGALPATRIEQFICARVLDGEDDENAWFKRLSADVPEDKHGILRRMIGDVVAKRLPVLRLTGVLPS